ncbi:DNA dependent reverse transcriptase [Pseudoloma neurophilia]|uniref:DNA dependent reverse transcriptase n=1 Tax=Pseudoloma neurophilia TaxID=146866 RepID=A0A0R0LXN4_9MICR|nr:DNA dependent reverse transcriptase [Pseudoloma neurophilia]
MLRILYFVFSLIDLKDGYFQVPLHSEDREKTTFLTPDNRLMQFKVMSQGYKNSPAIFQRGMRMVLERLIGKKCYNYLDDISIFGENLSEHDENLRDVLDRLNSLNFLINENKSIFRQSKITFLSHKISLNEIEASLSIEQAILDSPVPSNKKDLSGFSVLLIITVISFQL